MALNVTKKIPGKNSSLNLVNERNKYQSVIHCRPLVEISIHNKVLDEINVLPLDSPLCCYVQEPKKNIFNVGLRLVKFSTWLKMQSFLPPGFLKWRHNDVKRGCCKLTHAHLWFYGLNIMWNLHQRKLNLNWTDLCGQLNNYRQ